MWPKIDIQAFIVVVIVPTLALVVLTVTIAMIKGMFDPAVENAEIFKIIGPAFQTVVGGFMGFLGGYAVGKSRSS
jgi:hypothetical protein